MTASLQGGCQRQEHQIDQHERANIENPGARIVKQVATYNILQDHEHDQTCKNSAEHQKNTVYAAHNPCRSGQPLWVHGISAFSFRGIPTLGSLPMRLENFPDDLAVGARHTVHLIEYRPNCVHKGVFLGFVQGINFNPRLANFVP